MQSDDVAGRRKLLRFRHSYGRKMAFLIRPLSRTSELGCKCLARRCVRSCFFGFSYCTISGANMTSAQLILYDLRALYWVSHGREPRSRDQIRHFKSPSTHPEAENSRFQADNPTDPRAEYPLRPSGRASSGEGDRAMPQAV